jgi:hypothetical protein
MNVCVLEHLGLYYCIYFCLFFELVNSINFLHLLIIHILIVLPYQPYQPGKLNDRTFTFFSEVEIRPIQ